MTNISDNIIGVDFTQVWSGGLAKPRPFKTGTTVLGDDGRTYQFARANATIASGNTSVNITLSGGEYVAANSGGSASNASGVSLASGDYAWFAL